MGQRQSIVDDRTGEIVTVDDAWERHKRIIGLRNIAEKTFLALGEELYTFGDKEQWKELDYTSFSSYLASPEVNISRPVAVKLVLVYKKYSIGLNCSPVNIQDAGYAKLYMLEPYVTEQNIDEWIYKAANLSRSDLAIEIKEAFPPAPSPPLPDGKYNVIYADPPWTYDNSGFDDSAARHYPTMSIDEICELPISEMAGDPCVLFMWATSPLLPEAIRAMTAWGFEYKACRVWIKNRGPRIGWWLNTRHELLLIGLSSKNGGGHPNEKVDSVIESPVTKHSKKPDQIYTDIENMYSGKKIELFARQSWPGWEHWGNENVK